LLIVVGFICLFTVNVCFKNTFDFTSQKQQPNTEEEMGENIQKHIRVE